ncbi:MAG TPA: hypothetical protein VGI39_02700 [Polyangiaceae bacterium]
MTKKNGAAVAAVLAAVALSPSARANGRFPAAQQIVPSPHDPNVLALMATFGVEISQDNGANWDWVCETAVGYMSNDNPMLGITQSGNVLIGAFTGLGITTNLGCAWTLPTANIAGPVTDLVVLKSDPHSALVLASKYLAQDDAGAATYTTTIYATHDDGATFTPVGNPLDPEILPATIEVAPSDGQRVYVSGTRRVNGAPTNVLLASTDGGQTFKETDYAAVGTDAGVTDRDPYIAAVDPGDPNRVYIRQDNIDGTRLLVSDDGLATTREVWRAAGSLVGFALSPDGSKVFVGSDMDGLRVADKTALDFTKQVWNGQVLCLAFQGSRLLACSNEASGFAVGASNDQGVTWTPLLHLGCVRGPLACGPNSQVTIACSPNWPAQQQTLGGPDPTCAADAGTGTGGGGDGGGTTTPGTPGSKGCSCSAAGSGGMGAWLAGAVALAGGIGLGARRRARSRRGLGVRG